MSKYDFLPISKEDMEERGWDQVDFLLVNGDAYVDHPSFGGAIISRILEAEGFKVGMIAQPDWRSADAFKKLGKPKIACLVTGGNIDSMVNHYTAAKKRRSEDAYSPGGAIGLRPDRPTIVYSHRLREAFRKVPIILGGIEASLRRFAHYDYWDNKVRRSILVDSKADLLVYGMAERQIIDIAHQLASGVKVEDLNYIHGTAFLTDSLEGLDKYIEIANFDTVSTDKIAYAKAFKVQYEEQDPFRGKTIVQKHGDKYLVQKPPAEPLNQKELDRVYSLPYARTYHPSYEKDGGVPAIREVEFSIASQRGCFGSCSFCALTFHQGRIVQSRSHPSILQEAEQMTWNPNFKGYIHDVGGPTANFRKPSCTKQLKLGTCKDKQCLFPNPCSAMEVSHDEYLDLLRKLRTLPKVKKVFIRSGIRYDYLLADKDQRFLKELCEHHVSGQLKVAPEHIAGDVLAKMGKPGKKVFNRFVEEYNAINEELGKKQFLVPYFMSSHPGSTLKAAIELAEYVRDMGYNPEQVQDFIPTPGSLSTCMFYTGLDPRTMEKVYVPRHPHEKALQRALLQYRNPKNYELVLEALRKAGREDLIGFGPKCLIRPPKKGQLEDKKGSYRGKDDKSKDFKSRDNRSKDNKPNDKKSNDKKSNDYKFKDNKSKDSKFSDKKLKNSRPNDSNQRGAKNGSAKDKPKAQKKRR